MYKYKDLSNNIGYILLLCISHVIPSEFIKRQQ